MMFGLRSFVRKTRRQCKSLSTIRPILLPKRKKARPPLQHIPSLALLSDRTEEKKGPKGVVYSHTYGMSPHLDQSMRESLLTVISMAEREDILKVLKVELIDTEFYSPFNEIPEQKKVKVRTFTDEQTNSKLIESGKTITQIITLHGTPDYNIQNIFKIGFQTFTVWSSQSGRVAWFYHKNKEPFDTERGHIGQIIGCYTYANCTTYSSKWIHYSYDSTYYVPNAYCIPFCVLTCELNCNYRDAFPN